MESPRVLQLLSESFVSSWSLVKDLETLVKDDGRQPLFAKLAREYLDHYHFPVMMFVSLPNGTIVHGVNANTFMELDRDANTGSSNRISARDNVDSGMAYFRFLQDGLKKCKKYLRK